MAVLLARVFHAEEPDGLESPVPVAPAQDWLDAFTPHSARMDRLRGPADLAERLTRFAEARYGGVGCRSITGVESPNDSAALWGRFYSGGGTERCAEFISAAARGFEDSL